MDFEKMTSEELEKRSRAILEEMQNEGADLEALEAEARGINEEVEARKLAKENAEKREKIAEGDATNIVKNFKIEERKEMTIDSMEYRNAFLKTLNGEELGVEERAAFVATTGNTAAVLPTTMLNKIWDLVSTEHSILGDITIYRTGTILEVVKHTAIAAGAAKTVAENAANDDENNTFVKVQLSGKDFSKSVDVSYALGAMAIDALESYLTTEIANGLSAAMASDVIAQIGTDMLAANKITTSATGSVAFKDVAKAFGALKNATAPVVYASRATIYNQLVGMVDTNGRPIFQMNAQQGAAGSLIGAPVKVDDAVADGVILVGDPKQIVYNMVQDVMIESERDIKKHVVTYSGYARGSGALVAPAAFAQLTVKTA